MLHNRGHAGTFFLFACKGDASAFIIPPANDTDTPTLLPALALFLLNVPYRELHVSLKFTDNQPEIVVYFVAYTPNDLVPSKNAENLSESRTLMCVPQDSYII